MKSHDRIRIIATGALLEMKRRRDAAILAMFSAVFVVFLGAARFVGFETPAAGTFTMNLSLTLALWVSHLVTLLMSARLIPDELEQRTLYPLLARPLHRREVIFGKALAAWVTGVLVFTCLMIPALLLVPQLEFYAPGALLQHLLLSLAALALTAALGQALTLLLPRTTGVAVGAALIFGTPFILNFRPVALLRPLLPSPDRLNLVLRYTDGADPLPAVDLILLLGYGLIWTLLLISLSQTLFQRRAL